MTRRGSGMAETYDLAVVGAGICGLAHAWAASKRGLRVIVLERENAANGASIRNFGFITVTGQQQGDTWCRAMRSRDLWQEACQAADIPVVQQGLVMVGQRPEAVPVLEAFSVTPMGEGCELLAPEGFSRRFPMLRPERLAGALYSPHELRVESREAIPRLAAWLAEAHGVAFRYGVAVRAVAPPQIETAAGSIEAGAAVVCPGDDFASLFPERLVAYGLTRCRLHMLRVAPPQQDYRLPAAVMSDLGLVRYLGYAELPEAAALRSVLEGEQPEHLAQGIHLIAVQSGDGSMIIGDSHHYGDPPPPFADERVDELILEEFRSVAGIAAPRVIQRWNGTYASASDRTMLTDAP